MALAQAPDPRVIAAVGPEAQGEGSKPPTWGTTAAAGGDRVLAAHNVGPRGTACVSTRVGFAMAVMDQYETWTWTHEGIVDVPGDPGARAIDPSIAYNPITGDFVLISLVHAPIGVAHALPLHSQSGAPFADGWEELNAESELPPGDKCWIVAGEMTEEVQEFYISYNAGSSQDELHYIRSTDGGYTWVGGPIEVGSTQVTGRVGSYMAVVDEGPLYVLNVHVEENDANDPDDDVFSIRVLQGADQQDGTVQFSFLAASPFFQIPHVDIPFIAYYVTSYVPRPSAAAWAGITPAPRIAADPTDPNALHVVYADVADPNFNPNDADVDVDVCYVKLTRQYLMGSPYWAASNRLRVNDDQVDPGLIADQYLPDIAVGNEGVIHVIFYDDRDFEQDDDETDVKFHVYYAYSTDGGASFQPNQRSYLEDSEDHPSTHAWMRTATPRLCSSSWASTSA